MTLKKPPAFPLSSPGLLFYISTLKPYNAEQITASTQPPPMVSCMRGVHQPLATPSQRNRVHAHSSRPSTALGPASPHVRPCFSSRTHFSGALEPTCLAILPADELTYASHACRPARPSLTPPRFAGAPASRRGFVMTTPRHCVPAQPGLRAPPLLSNLCFPALARLRLIHDSLSFDGAEIEALYITFPYSTPAVSTARAAQFHPSLDVHAARAHAHPPSSHVAHGLHT